MVMVSCGRKEAMNPIAVNSCTMQIQWFTLKLKVFFFRYWLDG